MPVRATSSPKIALIKVDLPTPVFPKIARLNRPSAAFCLSYSVRNESRNQSVVPAIGPRVRGGKDRRATLRVRRAPCRRSQKRRDMVWHRSEKQSKIRDVGANVACGGDHQYAADLLIRGIASSDLGHYSHAIALFHEAMDALHIALPHNGADFQLPDCSTEHDRLSARILLSLSYPTHEM